MQTKKPKKFGTLAKIVLAGALACGLMNSNKAYGILEQRMNVAGIVSEVRTNGFDLDGSINIDSIMNGFCTYDLDTPDQDPGECGLYSLNSLSMTLGNYTFIHNPDSPNPALFQIWTFDYCYNVQSSTSLFDGLVYLNGLSKNYEDFIWDYTHLEPIDVRSSTNEYDLSDALPTIDTFPGLSTFNWERSFEVCFTDNSNNYFLIRGGITSLEVVPEPSTILLLGLGGLALLRKRKA